MSPFSVAFSFVVCGLVLARTATHPYGVLRFVGAVEAYSMALTLLAEEETTKLLAFVAPAATFGVETLLRRRFERAATARTPSR